MFVSPETLEESQLEPDPASIQPGQIFDKAAGNLLLCQDLSCCVSVTSLCVGTQYVHRTPEANVTVNFSLWLNQSTESLAVIVVQSERTDD